MFNSLAALPQNRLDSSHDGILVLGDDVAASIREAFRFNVRRILADLKQEGVLQKDLARKLGMPTSQISRMTGAGVIPHADALDEFILTVNRFLPVDKRVKPEDLFRDPESYERSKDDLLKELARRAGYEIRKPD